MFSSLWFLCLPCAAGEKSGTGIDYACKEIRGKMKEGENEKVSVRCRWGPCASCRCSLTSDQHGCQLCSWLADNGITPIQSNKTSKVKDNMKPGSSAPECWSVCIITSSLNTHKWHRGSVYLDIAILWKMEIRDKERLCADKTAVRVGQRNLTQGLDERERGGRSPGCIRWWLGDFFFASVWLRGVCH